MAAQPPPLTFSVTPLFPFPRPNQHNDVCATSRTFTLPPRQAIRTLPPATPTAPVPHPAPPPDSFTQLYEAAKRHEAAGRLPHAERLYRQLLVYENSGKVWSRLVNLTLRQPSHDPVRRARGVLRDALASLPTNAILWQKWADLEKRVGNTTRARELFRHSREANPYLPALYSSWGRMEMEDGYVARARDLFAEGVARVKPRVSVRLLQDWAVLESREGNAGVARDLLRKALDAEPRDAYLYQALALVEFKEGKFGTARESLELAVKYDPSHTQSWLTRAQIEEFLGNTDVARKVYRSALSGEERKSTAVQLWQAWARMEEKCGNDLVAVRLYAEAMNYFPDDAMLYCNFGDLQATRGRIREARELFEAGLGLDSKCPLLFQRAAALEVTQSNYEKARELYKAGSEAAAQFENFSAKSPGAGSGRESVAHLLHAWATFEWRQGRLEDCRRLFRQAVGIYARSGWIWMWFGHFEWQATQNGSLVRHYLSKAINAEPKSGQPWRAMADLERALGNEERARFCFRRACFLDSSRSLCDLDPVRPLARPTRYSYVGPTSGEVISEP